MTGIRLRKCPWHDTNHEGKLTPFVNESDFSDVDLKNVFYVECRYCGAQGPASETEKQAADSWNSLRVN